MTGTAVNVTDVPAHTGLAEVVMDTLTGNNGLTVIVSVLVGLGPVQVDAAFCICLKYVVVVNAEG